MISNNKKLYWNTVIILSIMLVFCVFTDTASAQGYFTDDPNKTNIGEYIKTIYTYAIGIVGIIATIVIMGAGFIWITSMGNASRVSNAKEWIGAALTGLALALFSYTILWIINPDLVNFKAVDPGNAEINLPPAEFTAASTYGVENCPPGVRKCGACQNCTPLQVPTKDGDYASAAIGEKLNTAYQNGEQNWRVTEAWPPVVNHQSICHQNGNCVDINFNDQSTHAEDVYELYNDLKDAGLNVLYEHPTNCAAYASLNVNCKVMPGTTAHFHVTQ